MTGCAACGLPTPRRLCLFCLRTAELIRSRRCVSCMAPIVDDSERRQGKCWGCLGRAHRSSAGTRYLLNASADARYRLAKAA